MTCQSVGVVADGSVNMAQTAERVRRSLKAHKHTSGGVKANRRSRFGIGGGNAHAELLASSHPEAQRAPEPPAGECEGARMRVSQINTFGCANDGQMEAEIKRLV